MNNLKQKKNKINHIKKKKVYLNKKKKLWNEAYKI